MARPFLPYTVSLVAGIAFGSIVPVPELTVAIVLAASLLMILLCRKFRFVLQPLLILCSFMMGILDIQPYMNPHVGPSHLLNMKHRETSIIEGMVDQNPKVTPDKTELTIAARSVITGRQYTPAEGRLLLTVPFPHAFDYGDYLRFHTRLHVPHPFRNPGGFDYQTYLKWRGILVRGYVRDETSLIVLRKGLGNPLRIRFEKFRNLIRDAIFAHAPGIEGQIIQALILGDQSLIDRQVMERFNRTGTTHIIAISGFNIGIVALFSLFLIRLCLKREFLLLRYNIEIPATLFAMLVVLLYTFIAGTGISVVRASLMVTVFMYALIINRDRDLYNTLSLAAFVILIATPYSLFDISFQLSFVAVASLIYFMPKCGFLLPALPAPDNNPLALERLCRRIRMLRRALALFFLVSLFATLGTLPLILYYFNRLSLVSLAANLIAVPILGILAIPACLLLILVAPFSPILTGWVMRLCETLVQISLFFIDSLAALPWAALDLSTPSFAEIAAFYLFMAWLGLAMQNLSAEGLAPPRLQFFLLRGLPALLALFLVADGIYLFKKDRHNGRLSFSFIDVGQGSSTLVRFPGGKNMLVDGGGFFDEKFDVGRYVVAPYLWHERITRIDTVVLTHPHPDHLQGLAFILDRFQVRQVWTNGDRTHAPLFQNFESLIADRGIPVRRLSASTPEFSLSGVAIRILNPPAEGFPGASGGSGGPESENIFSSAQATRARASGWPPQACQSLQSEGSGRSLFPGDSPLLNDRSLVMHFAFGEHRFLLASDISASVEMHIAQTFPDLACDLLLVPHHGSNRSNSLEFIDKVRPSWAVVSCGTDNAQGLPHPDVLARYEKAGAKVLRTDLHGLVRVTSDGRKIRKETFVRDSSE